MFAFLTCFNLKEAIEAGATGDEKTDQDVPPRLATKTEDMSYSELKERREKEKKVPLGRWATPEEISYSVAFLASAESDFITGQVISPNGGETIVGY